MTSRRYKHKNSDIKVNEPVTLLIENGSQILAYTMVHYETQQKVLTVDYFQ